MKVTDDAKQEQGPFADDLSGEGEDLLHGLLRQDGPAGGDLAENSLGEILDGESFRSFARSFESRIAAERRFLEEVAGRNILDALQYLDGAERRMVECRPVDEAVDARRVHPLQERGVHRGGIGPVRIVDRQEHGRLGLPCQVAQGRDLILVVDALFLHQFLVAQQQFSVAYIALQ